MTATWTNPETGRPMAVFVHGAEDKHGQRVLRVNKGTAATRMTFVVRAADTDAVVI
jgi:hypothetical protein